MNVIWIVADTFRRDHLGENRAIRTPALDALAARAVRFDRHYVVGFPTMPARPDHATGRWTLSFNPDDPVNSVDNVSRKLVAPLVTTMTSIVAMMVVIGVSALAADWLLRRIHERLVFWPVER
jgi:hypothetical protein